MRRDEQQAAIRSELERHSEQSDREIARRIGCDHKTVAVMRRKLAAVIPQKEHQTAEIRHNERKDTPKIMNIQSQPMKITEPPKDVVQYEPLPEGWEEFFYPQANGGVQVGRRPKSTPSTAETERRFVTMGPLPSRNAASESLRRSQEIRMRRAAEEREQEKRQLASEYAATIANANQR